MNVPLMIKSATVTIMNVRIKCRCTHVNVKVDIVEMKIIVKVRINHCYSYASNHKTIIDYNINCMYNLS